MRGGPVKAQSTIVTEAQLVKQVQALQALVAQQTNEISTLQTTVINQQHIVGLFSLSSGVGTNSELNLTGVNLHVVNGTGSTSDINGLGNLIVGYNEARSSGNIRTGSHNVIIGEENNYNGSYGGLVAGNDDEIQGAGSSVTGGQNNTAVGSYSSISGSQNNSTIGYASSISGGVFNDANGPASSISGGSGNTTNGGYNLSTGVYVGPGYPWLTAESF